MNRTRAASRLTVPVLVALSAIAACGTSPSTPEPNDVSVAAQSPDDRSDSVTEPRNEEAALTLFEPAFTAEEPAAAASVVAENAVDRSGPAVGPDAIVARFEATRTRIPGARAVVKHVAADGRWVAVHWQATADPASETTGEANIDLFAFDGGKVTEHWAMTQSVPATSMSGNTMFSDLYRYPTAPTEPTEDEEERRRMSVTATYDALFREHDASVLATDFAPSYLQHNPIAGNGTAALQQFFAGGAQFPASESVVSLADGDLVWTFAKAPGAAESDPFVAGDIFRFDGGIVEHWDVVPE
ncbi:nuclear transport factor 2 family protein [Rhodococcus fascians]|uniref:nuclear transport factor 2 family protein n=1 Tax=Nocardiaceae TaxID=85025 RepID=UPI0019D1D691|nr:MULTISPECIES: nuclear transport factor 2 family protein [Rhodococcus]MBW4777928.1 nuclear transport factor 2 family protein [Rhodococcus fascians]MDJ0001434.1 nuclear transport factor 2 family protein [Rhodococcus fascians]